MSSSSLPPSPSLSPPTAPVASPGLTRAPDEPAPRSNLPEIASPGVNVTLDDGTLVNLSSKALEDATVGTRDATPECSFTHLLIYDDGWGGVEMVVKLAKLGYAAIVHLKGASALFPMAELEENLRGMPGGSHLERKAIHEGISLMCVGYKYNSKGTLFFVAPEGAATTAEGEPYMTKWPDEWRNVLIRAVPRPALPSRYFILFNKVDKHNQMRQHELNVESKWHTADAFFRLFCTIIGMTVVDTMLAVKCESHPQHAVRDKTTLQFAEALCEEMLVNEIDGAVYHPGRSEVRARTVNTDAAAGTKMDDGMEHVLASYGCKADASPGEFTKYGKGDYAVQFPCVVCGKKASTYCTRRGCKKKHPEGFLAPPVCSSMKRNCWLFHIRAQDESAEEGPAGSAKRGRYATPPK